MPILPSVIYTDNGEEKALGLFSKLFDDRIILINEPITTELMSSVTAQLMFLDAKDSEAPIHMYICSPGGSVTDGFAIIDMMSLISAPVNTYAMGLVASMAALIFICGDKRHMLPHAELMLHQPLGGVQGQATDIEISTNRILKTKTCIIQLICDITGNDYKYVKNQIDRDKFYDAEEAVVMKLADVVIPYVKPRSYLKNEDAKKKETK